MGRYFKINKTFYIALEGDDLITEDIADSVREIVSNFYKGQISEIEEITQVEYEKVS